MQQVQLCHSNGPVAGIDDVGRWPLAGPVIAAAVILDERSPKLQAVLHCITSAPIGGT